MGRSTDPRDGSGSPGEPRLERRIDGISRGRRSPSRRGKNEIDGPFVDCSWIAVSAMSGYGIDNHRAGIVRAVVGDEADRTGERVGTRFLSLSRARSSKHNFFPCILSSSRKDPSIFCVLGWKVRMKVPLPRDLQRRSDTNRNVRPTNMARVLGGRGNGSGRTSWMKNASG